MRYEVILKTKDRPNDSFEKAGQTNVGPEHLKVQIDAYTCRAKKLDIYDYVILVNEVNDDGEFVRVIQ